MGSTRMIVSRRAFGQLKSVNRRNTTSQFHTTARNQVEKTLPESKVLNADPKKGKSKKQKSFFSRLFSTTLYASVLGYAGGVGISLYNDDFGDIFVENVPFAEPLVRLAEELRFKAKFQDFNWESIKPLSEEEIKSKLPKGEKWKDFDTVLDSPDAIDITEKKGPHISSRRPAEVTSGKGSEPLAESSSKAGSPVSTLVKKKSSTEPAVPLINLADTDPVIAESLASLNKLIEAINSSKATDETVAKVSREFAELSNKLKALKKKYTESAERQLAEQRAKFDLATQERTAEIKEALDRQTAKWQQEFTLEKEKLMKAFNERLAVEIEATKKAIMVDANNHVTAARLEDRKEFLKSIEKLVESERNSKLANLKELDQELSDLQQLTLNVDSVVTAATKAVNLNTAVASIEDALDSGYPVPLAPFVKKIEAVEVDDELVSLALKKIPEDALSEGVLSPAQLAARFRIITPALRSASLLPPNAGILGHLGSLIFSKLLFSKNGNPKGEDFESIVARTTTALEEGRVADAVEQVNSLKGESRLLARDWLVEGRKRLEVEFLVDLLKNDARLTGVK